MNKHYIAVLTGDKLTSYDIGRKLKNIFNQLSIEIIYVTNSDLENRLLTKSNILSLILPAITGEISSYPEIITDKSKQNINDYGYEGGAIWVTCASLYEISKGIAFTKSDGSIKKRSGAFDILPYSSAGPIIPPEQNHTVDPRALSLVPVKYYDINGDEHDTKILYCCGPTLLNTEDENINIISSFNISGIQSPAISTHQFGSGMIMASSLLPYITAHDITDTSDILVRNGLNLKQLKQDMLPHEKMRDIILQRQCYEIIKHNISTGRFQPQNTLCLR